MFRSAEHSLSVIFYQHPQSKTAFNIAWKITEGLNIGVFYIAADRNISTSPCGASLSLALDLSSNSLLYLGF